MNISNSRAQLSRTVFVCLTALLVPATAGAGLIGSSTGFDDTFSIDAAAGNATSIGGTDSLPYFVSGLAWDDNAHVLYGVNTNANQLIQINELTGTWTEIGTDPLLASVSDLAFDPNTGTLYSATTSYDTLISIDTSNGAVTTIGSLQTITDFRGMAFDPTTNTLYATDAYFPGLSDLYTINTTTGAATQVGALGDFAGGLAFDAATSTLYGTDVDNLLTINTSTGVAAEVGPHNFSQRGLTFIPSVPEPSSLALSLAALALLPLGRVATRRPKLR